MADKCGVLPMQLQHLLKEAHIPIIDHQSCLKQRAMGQMNEYMKLANIRTMQVSHDDDMDTISQLIAFAHGGSSGQAQNDTDNLG